MPSRRAKITRSAANVARYDDGVGTDRLIRRRPQRARGEILDVDPLAGVVLRGVGPPPQDVDPFRSAMTAARIREQDAVAGSAEQGHVRLFGMRRIDFVDRDTRRRRRLESGDGRVGLRRPRHVEARHALIEQQRRGADRCVGHESPLPYAFGFRFADAQRVVERDETHPDVMRHERADGGDPLVWIDARVVERVVKPVLAERAAALELGQVAQALRARRPPAPARWRTARRRDRTPDRA